MKAIKTIILAVCLLVGSQAYADMKESTENWTQGSPNRALGLIGGGDSADGTLSASDVPVLDGMYVLLTLAGAYMVARKKKSAKN